MMSANNHICFVANIYTDVRTSRSELTNERICSVLQVERLLLWATATPIAAATIVEIGVFSKAKFPNDNNAIVTIQLAPAAG